MNGLDNRNRALDDKPIVAALYLRLSKEDMDKINGGDDSESIKNQRLLLTDEAIKRGFVVGDVYSDDDYSGTDRTRPEFNRMIEDAKLKKFDVILCKTQSRFTRDMEVAEKYIHRVFPLLGIRFIGVVDHVDTDVKGNKKARQINALVNEWYVEDLSENIKAVYRSKMQQGQYLGSFALYGYIKDPEDHHRLIIDEEAAEVVRKIYRYCLEGYGAQNICYKLQEEGILTPTEYKQSKGMKFYTPLQSECYAGKHHLWNTTTVKRILSNEMYIGTLVQGRERKVSYKSKKVVVVPKGEWIMIPDCHEPIISKEDFYKAQEVMKLRRKYSPVSDVQHKIYPLAGKVLCKDCGNLMARSGRKGTEYNYLRCRLALKSKNKECSPHYIRYSELEAKILEGLQQHVDEILMDEKNLEDIAKECRPKKDAAMQEQRKHAQLRTEYEKLQAGLKNCYMDKYSGQLDEVLFSELKADYNRKIKAVQQAMEDLSDKVRYREEIGSSEKQAKELVKKYTTFLELTHELVFDFIDYVEVGEKDKKKEQELIVHWKF